jgi:hypothetical protein
MALWGKTDTLADAPKWLSADVDVMPSQDVDFAIFVDTDEAQVEANRANGIKTPGWSLYREYTDQNANVRKIVEVLVPMKVSAVDAGDLGVTGSTVTEDNIVADI